MAFVVVYDACVLYPAPLRDLLLRIARAGLVQAKWTEAILDECFRSILKVRPELKADALRRSRELMNRAVPDCIVIDYEDLIDSLVLPDRDDRHVLAAAIRAGSQMIVTFNLRDFPTRTLRRYGVEARHPDDFVIDQIGLASAAIINAVIEQARALKRPTQTIPEVLDTLRGCGLVQSTAKLRELFG